MGGNESKSLIKNNIYCPKCPLTPIISVSLEKKDNFKCEYRCPFMHFDQVPSRNISRHR